MNKLSNIYYDRHMASMTEGTARTQQAILAAETATRDFKAIAPTFIPGKFQTPEYARTRLREATELLELPDTVDETVDFRMQRAALLLDGSRSFHVLLAQSVLYGAAASPEVMAEQRAHLVALMQRPNVSIGILPLDARIPSPMSHVDIFDNSRVSVETLALTYSFDEDAPEVGMFKRIFWACANVAAYGDAAAALIRDAE